MCDAMTYFCTGNMLFYVVEWSGNKTEDTLPELVLSWIVEQTSLHAYWVNSNDLLSTDEKKHS